MEGQSIAYVVGLLAAFLTILYFIKDILILVARKLYYIFSPYKRYSSIHDFCSRSGSLKDKRSAKDLVIAIVDDEPENFPVEDINRSDFAVEWIKTVSLNDVEFLCDFDVIFLDITGVVKEDLQRGGFELIKRIKKKTKDTFVVGVSSKRFDPTLTEFWSLSDGQVKTPVNFVRFEEQVMKAWSCNFSSSHISSAIDDVVNGFGISMEERASSNRVIMKFLDDKFGEKDLLKRLSACSHAIDAHAIIEPAKRLKAACRNDD